MRIEADAVAGDKRNCGSLKSVIAMNAMTLLKCHTINEQVQLFPIFAFFYSRVNQKGISARVLSFPRI
jgi:hypothetical protein